MATVLPQTWAAQTDGHTQWRITLLPWAPPQVEHCAGPAHAAAALHSASTGSTALPRLDGAAAAVEDVHGLLGVGLLDDNLAVAHLHGASCRTEGLSTACGRGSLLGVGPRNHSGCHLQGTGCQIAVECQLSLIARMGCVRWAGLLCSTPNFRVVHLRAAQQERRAPTATLPQRARSITPLPDRSHCQLLTQLSTIHFRTCSHPRAKCHSNTKPDLARS